MLEKAILRALAQIEKIFANRYQAGKAIGKVIGAAVIVAPASHFLKKQLAGGKTQDVRVDKIEDIHFHENEGANRSGNGTVVAAVYQGDDGGYYKLFDGRWHAWDGQNWV